VATGTVKWFDKQKGFGFISPDLGGSDVFVHISAVEAAGLRTLKDGERVEYQLVTERGKTAASNLALVPKNTSSAPPKNKVPDIPSGPTARSGPTETVTATDPQAPPPIPFVHDAAAEVIAARRAHDDAQRHVVMQTSGSVSPPLAPSPMTAAATGGPSARPGGFGPLAGTATGTAGPIAPHPELHRPSEGTVPPALAPPIRASATSNVPSEPPIAAPAPTPLTATIAQTLSPLIGAGGNRAISEGIQSPTDSVSPNPGRRGITESIGSPTDSVLTAIGSPVVARQAGISSGEVGSQGVSDSVSQKDSVSKPVNGIQNEALLSVPRAQGVSDQPNPTDHIGFRPYVDALAQLLTNKRTEPPLTISLEGDWGSGKSSFIDQLEAAVRTRLPNDGTDDPVIIRFNAWHHDKDEALWASFALKLASRVVPRSFTQRLRRSVILGWRRINLRELRPLLAWASVVALLGLALLGVLAKFLFLPTQHAESEPSDWAKWVAYVTRWAPVPLCSGVSVFLLSTLKKTFKLAPRFELAKYFDTPNYAEKVGFLERFHEDFTRYVKTYLDGRRAFLFVDDLDRCEVPKAVELLQALNLMLPSLAAGDASQLGTAEPRAAPLFVVIAMDRQKIAAGIAARNKELLRFLPAGSADARRANDQPAERENERRRGLSFGYEFVEKFVQLPIRIPRLTAVALTRFLDDLLDSPIRAAQTSGMTLEHTLKSDLVPLSRGIVTEHTLDIDLVERDAPEVRRVMEMVAPALGFNPRRLKQYLNLLRFRYLVASKTGQLRTPQSAGWTVPQLGKVVAIELGWPLALDRFLAAPKGLRDLALLAKADPGEARAAPSAELADLAADVGLMTLIRSKAENEGQYDLEEACDWLPGLYGTSSDVSTSGGAPRTRR
jgi:cold shock CspA family protein